MTETRTIAYFSMEIAFHTEVPSYAGGLGVLAGDTIRSAADLRVPMLAVTLVNRRGYFRQQLDATGWQQESDESWSLQTFLEDTGVRAEVALEGRPVYLRAWRYTVRGVSGFGIPIYLLDADLPVNSASDRTLTDSLYGGDERYRLCQEVILGIGGVRILRALGHLELLRFHMNEGHSALLTLELLREHRRGESLAEVSQEDVDYVRRQCVFTTHTPVAAGHDQFDLELVDQIFGDRKACGIHDPICHENRLNMTYLALAMSHYVNGVAKHHADISRRMFAEYQIDAITNGVHAATWVCDAFAALYDHHLPGWRQDNFNLRYALSIPNQEIWTAHQAAKSRLLDHCRAVGHPALREDILTLGFARRATTYKRGDLIFTDPERLRSLARRAGGLQLIFAGKAHPNDREGKLLIQRIVAAARELADSVSVIYLENYDLALAGQMIAGVDVWLNTPEPPLEASGTSGMKAALNGVPSLSILDGWWIEGCIEGITGWGIAGHDGADGRAPDAEAFYTALESVVIPLFQDDRAQFIDVMRHAIALNGAFFNTQRMVQQYVTMAYFE